MSKIAEQAVDQHGGVRATYAPATGSGPGERRPETRAWPHRVAGSGRRKESNGSTGTELVQTWQLVEVRAAVHTSFPSTAALRGHKETN